MMQNFTPAVSELPECTEEVSLEKVYHMLASSSERMVAVVDSRSHRVPIGIITESSICAQILGRKRDPRGLTAANVLDCNFKKARRADLAAASEFNHLAKDTPVLVVDRDRRLLGLLKDVTTWDRQETVPATIAFTEAAIAHPAPAILGLA